MQISSMYILKGFSSNNEQTWVAVRESQYVICASKRQKAEY